MPIPNAAQAMRCIPVGELQANCYLVWDDSSREAVVIDPGAEAERLINEIQHLRLQVRAILNTHGHGDHIGGNAMLRKATGAPIWIHPADQPMLRNPIFNLSPFVFGGVIVSPPADENLNDGVVLTWGHRELRVIATPGHTAGSVCLLGKGILFTGDTLFAGSVGRTDFPGGNSGRLIQSIRERLLVLPDTIEIYPGHGPATRMGTEKKVNPFLA